MFIVVSYDVGDTDTREGARRLRKVAKLCQNYGQRVQYSVFECNVGQKEWAELKIGLLNAFDSKKDSLRFYHLGSSGDRIEHHGIKQSVDFDGSLII